MRPLPLLLLLAALAGCGGNADEEPSSGRSTPSTAQDASRGDASLRLAVLGDSYSNGEAVGQEHAWPKVMAAQLTRGGLATQVVANPSVTGATTAEMLGTGLDPVRESRPDVIAVMLGVNDQVQGRTTEQFAGDEDRAVAAAIEITGSARRVIVIDIPDYSVSPDAARFGSPAEISAQIDAFNLEIRKVAEQRGVQFVSVVDISRRLGTGGISDDGLHPSKAQLAAWADRIAAVARQRLQDLSG